MASRGRLGRWDARLGPLGRAKSSPIEQSGATIWPSAEPGKASESIADEEQFGPRLRASVGSTEAILPERPRSLSSALLGAC